MESEQDVSEPPPKWVYAPADPAWQLGPLKGRFGRGQAPQAARSIGITGETNVPLHQPTPWAVPGAEARAVVFGFEGGKPAIELIEVDRGTQLWRHGTACLEPVIGVTAKTIVCGGASGVRGVGLDGKPVWSSDEPLIAITGARIVVGKEREVVVLGADDGHELVRVALPVNAGSIVASCEGELLAYAVDQLQRIADVKGKPAITWQVPFVPFVTIAPPPVVIPVRGRPVPRPVLPPRPSTLAIESIECGESILVATRPIAHPQVVPAPVPRTLRAIARASGKLTGMIEQVRGWWPARTGDALEISAAGMVRSWPRDLGAASEGLALPILGELLDARGDRRLIRATPLTAVILDREGVRAYVALATPRAVLGETAILGTGLRRIEIPKKPTRVVRIPPRRAGVALAAELRDLPAITELTGATIEKPDTGKAGVAAIAIDPREPGALYAIALEASSSTVARADLSAKTWRWQRTDGCGANPVGLALAAGIVVCAGQGVVRATTRDGAARWERTFDTIDAIEGAGDAVLVFAGDRLTILGAGTGNILGRIASPDGGRVRAALLRVPIPTLPGEDTTWLVTFERDRVVARLPAISMIALWSLRVDGVVASIAASGEGVLVGLDDGDAYRVELATAAVTPLGGLGLTWRATGELVTGETLGGPIPGIPGPPPIRIPVRPGQPALADRNPEAPNLWVPIPAPPPLGDSWQYTLYERTGGLRARNDYALAAPITTSTRGPAGSPLVISSGPAQREVLVLDPRTGDPLRRVVLPGPGLVFGTIVDGTPTAGTVLVSPLRIVLF